MQQRVVKNALLFAAAQVVALVFSINYVEDPDSLRFALALQDYKLTLLQPHFPGYPVFCALAKLLYLPFDNLGATFACLGGASLFGVFVLLRRLFNIENLAQEVVLFVFVLFQPLLLVMAVRFMPDMLGAAMSLFCVLSLVQKRSDRMLFIASFATGLLAGVRLSNLPLVLLPFLWALFHSRRKLLFLILAALGVLVWLVPLTVLTGPQELLRLAQQQSGGHFNDFGGTIGSIPDLGTRAAATFRSLWADGLGAYWPGRSLVSLLPTVGIVCLSAAAILRGNAVKAWRNRELQLVVAACTIYLIWIFLFQNVVHKPRHVLPLLPFVIAFLYCGALTMLNGTHTVRRVLPPAIALVMILFGSTIARQHRMPSAMAQAVEYVRNAVAIESGKPTLVSTDLVCTFVRRQGIDVDCLTVDPREPHSVDISRRRERILVIGEQALRTGDRTSRDTVFYHNPFVNRMWPQVVLRDFPSSAGGVNK